MDGARTDYDYEQDEANRLAPSLDAPARYPPLCHRPILAQGCCFGATMEIMEIRDAVERFRGESGTSTIFGEPHQTSDGSTIITVLRLHRRWRREPIPVPVGVFSIHEGEPSWSPAVDHTRAALMGEFIGLAAAVIATLAVLRRPPWPDVTIQKG
ncbi:hypothetical protein [Rhodococcus qingshengii]|uniref:hypothetical protein n=1 Tax=Rhodococcus qingshengii TaxID=334542 RepID=UPI00360069FA